MALAKEKSTWDACLDPVDWPSNFDDVLYVYPDPEKFPDEQCYTLTCTQGRPGWRTDMGCPGYGLPKQVAVQIVARSNLADDY